MNGIELQDREFFAAIREQREPNASSRNVCPRCRRLEQQLERQLEPAEWLSAPQRFSNGSPT